MPEELASCPFQQIQIARVVNVVSHGAISITHPVIPAKDILRHADQFNKGIRPRNLSIEENRYRDRRNLRVWGFESAFDFI